MGRYNAAVSVGRDRRQAGGAVQTSATVSLALAVAVAGGVFLWALDDLGGKLAGAAGLWAIRGVIGAAVLPWALLGLWRLRVLLGWLELELYESTGWRVDLDGDGQTGEDERVQVITALPEREVIRVVPVHTNAPQEPTLRLPDGRELDAAKVRDFVIGADTIGLALSAWKGRGWTRQEWEAARDLLALHGLASERAEGQAGKLEASPGQCMRAFGL
jgi:hypothetical protein